MYRQNRLFFYFYASLVFLLMCISNSTLYTPNIPDVLLPLLFLLPPLFLFVISSKNKAASSMMRLLFYVGVVYIMLFIKHPQITFFRGISTLASICCVFSVLLLGNDDKEKLLDYITNVIVFISILSLAGWIMHLLGYNVPVFQHVNLNDDQHDLNNHFVYYDNVDQSLSIFPRYRGIFIEPGQLATPYVYLFFARGGKIWEWKNMVLLISIFLSFSLAGYVALGLGLFLNSFIGNKKYKFLKFFLFSIIVGTITFFIIKAENSDNPLYSLIIERLEYDEESGIAGNNRSDDIFDYYFEQYLKSDDIVFGIGDEIELGDSNWTNHASGIKKFFLNFGIVGVIFMVLLTVGLLKANLCSRTMAFFVVVWAAYIARDLLQSLFWLIIVILGFYNLKSISIKENGLRLDRNLG